MAEAYYGEDDDRDKVVRRFSALVGSVWDRFVNLLKARGLAELKAIEQEMEGELRRLLSLPREPVGESPEATGPDPAPALRQLQLPAARHGAVAAEPQGCDRLGRAGPEQSRRYRRRHLHAATTGIALGRRPAVPGRAGKG